MFRFIYWLFRKRFNKFIYHDQRLKPKDFELLDYKFTDSNGMRYYRYREEFKIPLSRKGEIEDLMIELKNCMTNDEMGKFIEGMKKALNDGDLTMIGFLLTEIEDRRNWLARSEILWHLAAAITIREDEDPAEFDEEIQRQKIAQFQKDHALHDFFVTSGLIEFVPYLNKSEVDWNAYMKEKKIRARAINEMIISYKLQKKEIKESQEGSGTKSQRKEPVESSS